MHIRRQRAHSLLLPLYACILDATSLLCLEDPIQIHTHIYACIQSRMRTRIHTHTHAHTNAVAMSLHACWQPSSACLLSAHGYTCRWYTFYFHRQSVEHGYVFCFDCQSLVRHIPVYQPPNDLVQVFGHA